MAEQIKPSGIDWIGDIPESWKVRPLKYLAKCNQDVLLETTAPDYSFRYVDIGSVTYERGITGYQELRFEDSPSRARRKVSVGDTIISTVRTYLKAIAIISDSENVIVSTGFAVYTPDEAIYPQYLYYFCKSEGFVQEIDKNSYGIAYPAINTDLLSRICIAYPCYEEQQAIADFLDKECAQIDSITADLEKQIELLQQYKKSLITETVTKGLDKSVPMKDSGVEWIGEIPEHWEISRVRHLASLCSGATPSKDVLSYWEGNIPWVSSQEVKSDIIKDTSLHISEEAINSCSTQLMPAGTLVMVVRSGILQHTIPVALLGVPATINQDIKAFQFNHLMLPAYFKYYIQGENDALLSVIIKDKTTVESVDNQLLLSLKIMVPPIEEQKAIVAFLNYKCGYIDKILNDKQEQLNLLMQHKKSLIYEYVTGKKRVKEVR